MANAADALIDEAVCNFRDALRQASANRYHGSVGVIIHIVEGKPTYYEAPQTQTRHVRDIEREAKEKDRARAG